jgi:tetratricopeptide (TPR) repeat protein
MIIALWLAALAFQPDTAMLRRVYEENLVRRQREYGAADARTAQAARDLGLFLRGAGDRAGARRALAEAVRLDESALGTTAPQTLEDVSALAAISPPSEAERLLRRAAESTDATVSGPALSALAEFRKAAGDHAGAATLLRRALAKAEIADGKDGAIVALVLTALALEVPPKEGIPLLERALAIDVRLMGPQDPQTRSAARALARCLRAAGRQSEAAAIEQQFKVAPSR